VRAFWALWIVGGIAALSGCGSGAFSERYEKKLKEAQEQGPYTTLYNPIEIGDPVAFRLRIPRLFKTCYNDSSGHSRDNSESGPRAGLVAINRLEPAEFYLPGFQLCYEGAAISSKNKQEFNYYCYIATGEKTAQSDAALEQLRTVMQEKVKADNSDSKTDIKWEPVKCVSPTGKDVAWQKISGNFRQSFYATNDNTLQPMQATTEFYLFRQGKRYLLVGYRWPNQIAEDLNGLNLPAKILTSCGTVETPAEEKPDPKAEKKKS